VKATRKKGAAAAAPVMEMPMTSLDVGVLETIDVKGVL
jgi:hypothetical protein